MNIDWLIHNSIESNGFVAKRVHLVTYNAICIIYGMCSAINHGKTKNGLHIGQILTPYKMYFE